ncbi:esterase-like activity of phytase family protein [Mesobacterium sp. TK19101]|uniref:Esterase-like activity of phytase family protein n=1 Tax=Mesobacterium hydrothermale TaxID=3111907 RepID=A0ABU6HD20_9RHOB|nr:esterase-like activity of phytase family protein [Mesobacterium sp. TK19101]MEC3859750.1 esterase-like activity of phytase family protein [Mesobacterium sp. TK19101]
MRRRLAGELIKACLTVLVLAQTAGAEPSARLVGVYRWFGDEPGDADLFGGFSAIEVTEDGGGFTALTDHSDLFSGRFLRENGVITGIERGLLRHLTDDTGARLDHEYWDSEGLAVAPDGRIFVSFEGFHRVWDYTDPARTGILPRPAQFNTLIANSSLEALAVDARGWLYTLPERSGRLTRPYPVYRYRNGNWDVPFHIRRDAAFLPVGADIGPDGRFYLLERAFNGYAFSNRVRRFSLSETELVEECVILQTEPAQYDNLEGLSVWRDETGAIRLTMIADDNFNWFQQTQIVEYTIAE